MEKEVLRATVTGPDGRKFKFPATMDRDEVAKAMARIYAKPQPQAKQ